MADRLADQGTNGANKAHNIADVSKLIRDCAREMIEIKEARKELNERAGEIRQRLRDSGVETKAFEFAVRVSEMEQEAKGNYIDWLRVSFEALGVGQQGSLFPDDDTDREGPHSPPTQ